MAFAILQGPSCGPTEQTLESERITTDNKSFITRMFNGTDRAPRDEEKKFHVCLFHYFDFDLRSLLDTLWDGDDNLKLGIREFGSSDFAFSPLLDYNFHYQLFFQLLYLISFYFSVRSQETTRQLGKHRNVNNTTAKNFSIKWKMPVDDQ